jgi:putative ABC transport system substrate-binding protein
MRRRDFAALLGAAVVFLPHAGNAEQRAMRRVGVLGPGAPADSGQFALAFVQGLKITGYVDGANVALEYRWGRGPQ